MIDMQAPGRIRKSVAELGDLMEKLVARDPRGARKAGKLHVRSAASVAIRILRESQAAPTPGHAG